MTEREASSSLINTEPSSDRGLFYYINKIIKILLNPVNPGKKKRYLDK